MNALDEAKTEHASARVAFSDNPTAEAQKRLTKAAADLAKAEREAAALAAEERARQKADFDKRRATDAERVAQIEALIPELVELERLASEKIDAIARICGERQFAFIKTRQLATDLGILTPMRPPATSGMVSDVVQHAISQAQQADGRRNGNNAGQVGTWLRPSQSWQSAPSRVA